MIFPRRIDGNAAGSDYADIAPAILSVLFGEAIESWKKSGILNSQLRTPVRFCAGRIDF
jgi:hypothetical protein